METLVANMTKEEFIQTIELIVERKLQKMFDSLEEMALKPEVKARLLHQQQLVSEGEHGRAFADVLSQLPRQPQPVFGSAQGMVQAVANPARVETLIKPDK